MKRKPRPDRETAALLTALAFIVAAVVLTPKEPTPAPPTVEWFVPEPVWEGWEAPNVWPLGKADVPVRDSLDPVTVRSVGKILTFKQ